MPTTFIQDAKVIRQQELTDESVLTLGDYKGLSHEHDNKLTLDKISEDDTDVRAVFNDRILAYKDEVDTAITDKCYTKAESDAQYGLKESVTDNFKSIIVLEQKVEGYNTLIKDTYYTKEQIDTMFANANIGTLVQFDSLTTEQKAELKGEKGNTGEQGERGYSAYEVYKNATTDAGDIPLSESAWLTSLTAYGMAVSNGYGGTAEQWLETLTAYGVAKSNGYTGTKDEWLTSITAYGQWLAMGNTGTKEDWIASLKGAKGDKGDKGDTGLNNFELAVSQGFGGDINTYLGTIVYENAKYQGIVANEQEWKDYIGGYGTAKSNGYTGTATDYVNDQLYITAKSTGFTGTKTELVNQIAYITAKSDGYSGTLTEWLITLTAYGIAVKNGYQGTEEQWLESLRALPVVPTSKPDVIVNGSIWVS